MFGQNYDFKRKKKKLPFKMFRINSKFFQILTVLLIYFFSSTCSDYRSEPRLSKLEKQAHDVSFYPSALPSFTGGIQC
jgi:hypothetical protein